MKTAPRTAGFSLLEVMVAIAILGLGLTAILSAQAGSFSAATQARSLSVATGLARCKMLEVEEKLSATASRTSTRTTAALAATTTTGGDALHLAHRETGAPGAQAGRARPRHRPEPRAAIRAGAGGSGGPAGIGALAGARGRTEPDGRRPRLRAKIGDVAQGVTGGSHRRERRGRRHRRDGDGPRLSDPQEVLRGRHPPRDVTVHWADGNRDRTLEIMQWYTRATAPAALHRRRRRRAPPPPGGPPPPGR
jgi:prepilin-type N-terminal cleavage/methylation domain-containing protein